MIGGAEYHLRGLHALVIAVEVGKSPARIRRRRKTPISPSSVAPPTDCTRSANGYTAPIAAATTGSTLLGFIG
jgi:hypothetical protein